MNGVRNSGGGSSRPPMKWLGLPVVRWEYKELYEKDEDFEIVYDDDGKPKVADSWVVIVLRAPDGEEVPVEVDREPFDKYILPILRLGEKSVR